MNQIIQSTLSYSTLSLCVSPFVFQDKKKRRDDLFSRREQTASYLLMMERTLAVQEEEEEVTEKKKEIRKEITVQTKLFHDDSSLIFSCFTFLKFEYC